MSEYECNVVAYISMYIRDNVADPKSDNDDLFCYDVVYDIACELAEKFIGSEFDSSLHSLFDCIENYMESKEVTKFLEDYK